MAMVIEGSISSDGYNNKIIDKYEEMNLPSV